MLLKILGVLYHVKHNEMSSFHFNNGFGLPENKQCNLCNFAVTYQRVWGGGGGGGGGSRRAVSYGLGFIICSR